MLTIYFLLFSSCFFIFCCSITKVAAVHASQTAISAVAEGSSASVAVATSTIAGVGVIHAFAGASLLTQALVATGAAGLVTVASVGIGVTVTNTRQAMIYSDINDPLYCNAGQGWESTTKTGMVYIMMEGVQESDLSPHEEVMQELFVNSYNNVSGLCAGTFERVMRNVTLVEHIPVADEDVPENVNVGEFWTLSLWEAEVTCNGCSDTEPIFSIYSESYYEEKRADNISSAGDEPDTTIQTITMNQNSTATARKGDTQSQKTFSYGYRELRKDERLLQKRGVLKGGRNLQEVAEGPFFEDFTQHLSDTMGAAFEDVADGGPTIDIVYAAVVTSDGVVDEQYIHLATIIPIPVESYDPTNEPITLAPQETPSQTPSKLSITSPTTVPFILNPETAQSMTPGPTPCPSTLGPTTVASNSNLETILATTPRPSPLPTTLNPSSYSPAISEGQYSSEHTSVNPSIRPTRNPSINPTIFSPTTGNPTVHPEKTSALPAMVNSSTLFPTSLQPSVISTSTTSALPESPSLSPSISNLANSPSGIVTSTPRPSPSTDSPTVTTDTPTLSPTAGPTARPSKSPLRGPTPEPTLAPSDLPSTVVSPSPTLNPSFQPTGSIAGSSINATAVVPPTTIAPVAYPSILPSVSIPSHSPLDTFSETPTVASKTSTTDTSNFPNNMHAQSQSSSSPSVMEVKIPQYVITLQAGFGCMESGDRGGASIVYMNFLECGSNTESQTWSIDTTRRVIEIYDGESSQCLSYNVTSTSQNIIVAPCSFGSNQQFASGRSSSGHIINAANRECLTVEERTGNLYLAPCSEANENQSFRFAPSGTVISPRPVGDGLPLLTDTSSSSPILSPSGFSSNTPSDCLSSQPTAMLSQSLSLSPTIVSSNVPSTQVTGVPSNVPSLLPTVVVSNSPSLQRSAVPTELSSSLPTHALSSEPPPQPTQVPSTLSISPLLQPTLVPSQNPTDSPTLCPSVSPQPSDGPTGSPTDSPKGSPIGSPTGSPARKSLV